MSRPNRRAPARQIVARERSGAIMPAVIYSIGASLNGGGIGSVAVEAIRGLASAGYLARLLVLGGAGAGDDVLVRFPERLVANRISARFLPDRLRDRIFDGWAARHIRRCDVFYGWANHSLRSIAAAHRHGAVTLLDRGSTEAGMQYAILEEENRLAGVFRVPMHPSEVRRARIEYAATDLIAVPSEFVRDSFREAGFPDQKLFLNPLGVDAGRFAPPEGPPERFRVVFLGRVSLQKGVLYLLKAWARLRPSDAELLLVGPVDPEVRPLVQEQIRKAAPAIVRLVGPSTEPERVLRDASVLVLPSVQDGFGMVVLEAMACGVPVIVAEHVGAKDCVREAVDGFVVPARDIEAIAERLSWLHKDRVRGALMGRNAREQALRYTWNAYRDRLLAKIEALAGPGERVRVP